MWFSPDEVYHIYNRGNQKQVLFRTRSNYLYFLEKVVLHIQPRCDILAWSLMPNHFHFLVSTSLISCEPISDRSLPIQSLAEGIRLLLSGFTKGFNKANGLTGNLFQQKTKSRLVSDPEANYCLPAFHYVHQNAWRAGLVNRMEDWEFCSFREYLSNGNEGICNKVLACQLLDLDKATFYRESYAVIPCGQKTVIEKGIRQRTVSDT